MDLVASFLLTAAGGFLATLYWRLRERSRRRTELAKIEASARADVERIKAAGEVLATLAGLEHDQADRLHIRLDRMQPPSPIEPPDPLGD
jgi:hypothetical protein